MARAALVNINLTTGEMYHTLFSTEDGNENPSQMALNMLNQIKNDFPEMHHVVVEDEEAKKIRVDSKLNALFGPENNQ